MSLWSTLVVSIYACWLLPSPSLGSPRENLTARGTAPTIRLGIAVATIASQSDVAAIYASVANAIPKIAARQTGTAEHAGGSPSPAREPVERRVRAYRGLRTVAGSLTAPRGRAGGHIPRHPSPDSAPGTSCQADECRSGVNSRRAPCPVLVALRSNSRLMPEDRTGPLRGPFPDLSPAKIVHRL
jgi:hypothetical protein